MKTITVDDEAYKKLLDAKQTLNARSYSEVIRKMFSADRINWVYKVAGKIKIDQKNLDKVGRGWKEWKIQ